MRFSLKKLRIGDSKMNAWKEASILSGFRQGALWSAVYNFPSSCEKYRLQGSIIMFWSFWIYFGEIKKPQRPSKTLGKIGNHRLP